MRISNVEKRRLIEIPIIIPTRFSGLSTEKAVFVDRVFKIQLLSTEKAVFVARVERVRDLAMKMGHVDRK